MPEDIEVEGEYLHWDQWFLQVLALCADDLKHQNDSPHNKVEKMHADGKYAAGVTDRRSVSKMSILEI